MRKTVLTIAAISIFVLNLTACDNSTDAADTTSSMQSPMQPPPVTQTVDDVALLIEYAIEESLGDEINAAPIGPVPVDPMNPTVTAVVKPLGFSFCVPLDLYITPITAVDPLNIYDCQNDVTVTYLSYDMVAGTVSFNMQMDNTYFDFKGNYTDSSTGVKTKFDGFSTFSTSTSVFIKFNIVVNPDGSYGLDLSSIPIALIDQSVMVGIAANDSYIDGLLVALLPIFQGQIFSLGGTVIGEVIQANLLVTPTGDFIF